MVYVFISLSVLLAQKPKASLRAYAALGFLSFFFLCSK